jgi:hypothetical protein
VRRDEEFVGRALVAFLGGPSSASVSDGEDPPDLYLHVGGSRTGVEVTRLSQFTFESDGTLGNRATQDFFGIRLLNELDANAGPTLPEELSLLIGLWVPVPNASRFKRSLTEWVAQIAAAPKEGFNEERKIEGSKVTVSVIEQRPSGKKIVGFVVNKNSSADIGLNARLVLEDRIRSKAEICGGLSKPIWLAVLNDYWLADADTYALAGTQLNLSHCFERIFLVSDQGAVNELAIGA